MKCLMKILFVLVLLSQPAFAARIYFFDFDGGPETATQTANKGTGQQPIQLLGTPTPPPILDVNNERGEPDTAFKAHADDQRGDIDHTEFGSKQKMTIALWFKSTLDNGIRDQLIGGKYYPRMFLDETDGSKITANFRAGGTTVTVYGATVVDDMQWHFIALTFNGETVGGVTVGDVNLYVDGHLDGTTHLTGTTNALIAIDSSFQLACRDNSGNMENEIKGWFDDVMIYDEALSLEQLNAFLPPMPGNLNTDNIVNFADFAILANNWLNER